LRGEEPRPNGRMRYDTPPGPTPDVGRLYHGLLPPLSLRDHPLMQRLDLADVGVGVDGPVFGQPAGHDGSVAGEFICDALDRPAGTLLNVLEHLSR